MQPLLIPRYYNNPLKSDMIKLDKNANPDEVNLFHKDKFAAMINDQLLVCLVELARIIGRPSSDASLLAGLPLTGNFLTVELFPRAAAKLDMKATLTAFELPKKQTHFFIPVVLLLHNNSACLLTDITENNLARVITPPLVDEVPLEDLQKLYTGEAFLLEPNYSFTSRSSHIGNEPEEKRWFWKAIKNLWSSYSEMLVASFLINIFALALPLFTMNIYDRVVPNKSFDTLWVLTSGILLVFIFDVLMRVLRGYFIDQASKTVDLQVSATILEKVIGIKMVERPESIGAFANTIQSFDAVREFITSTTITILVDLPFSILFLVIIGLIGGEVVWVPLLVLPLVIFFGFIMQKPLIEFTKISHKFAAEKQAILYETLSGIETVKTHGAENVMQSRWEQVVNLAAHVGIKLRFLVNMSMFFSLFIQQLSTVLVIIVGVYKISHNELTTGALIACTILSSRALAPMAQISALLTRYHQTITSLESLNNIMNLPSERQSALHALHVVNLKGEVEFRDLSFSYVDRASPILQDLNFKINPGEHVGIIGRIGSGKTTIAKLMLGLLQPNAGAIYFDGIDQSNLDISELRKFIGYVPQDVTLFYGTLHDNITFGSPHVDDSKIIKAIDVSCIDEFLKPILGSYEAHISENGKNLSGGQRRIIAIARAILLDPPILVFDEPSHSMDNNTETAIKNKLAVYIQNKTFILMTHRTPMLSLVDRIIIIDRGKIITDGPRDIILRALSDGQIKVPKG